MEILANLNVESREEEEMETTASLNVKIREEEVMETLGPNPSTPPNHQHSRVAQATGFSYEFQSTSDVDLPPLNNSKTQLSDDNCVTSNLHHDNRNVRKLKLGKSYGKSLLPSREEDMVIGNDPQTYEDIHPKTTQGIVPQQKLKILNCQPSSVDTNEIHSSYNPNRFLQGHVRQGTPQAVLHLLGLYSTELAIGCHGILTTKNNQPTELGKYEECVWSGKGYQYVEDVGSGSNGCVKLYRDNTTNVYFVKKQIFERGAVSLSEVKFLSEVNHDNIVKLYGFILRDNTPEILMEFAGVSLVEYITTLSCPDVSEDKIIKITYQGVSGLEHLASKRIIHYDIKPENLCVLEKGSNIMLKITDFGSAKKEMEPPNFMGFTIGYESPELDNQLVKYLSSILNTDNCVMTTKSDIFSFALSIMFVYKKEDVVISFINNGKMSYKELTQAIFESLVANPSLVKDQLIPDACCSEMRIILRAMVEKDPQERPTARKIKRHMEDVFGRKILTNSMAVGTGFQQCGTS